MGYSLCGTSDKIGDMLDTEEEDKNVNPRRDEVSLLRCGATWVRRVEGLPVRCAKCRSPYWNVKE